jgi:hypothetical protein
MIRSRMRCACALALELHLRIGGLAPDLGQPAAWQQGVRADQQGGEKAVEHADVHAIGRCFVRDQELVEFVEFGVGEVGVEH